jgi:hypothetical protein
METEYVNALKRELFILTVRRTLRPSIKENSRMWAILAELYELTNEEIYNLKP